MNKASSQLVTKSSRSSNSRKSKIKFRCDNSSTPLKVLQARGWTRVLDAKDPTWDIWWCDTSELKLALDGPTKLEPNQRVSHFRNHCELTRKNYLYRNLRRYRRLLLKAGKNREAELCNAMPMSFELPAEYRMLVEEHRRCQGITWIVKPAGGSQGRGIFLFQRLKDLTEWRAKECVSTVIVQDPMDADLVPSNPPPTFVVQKYIDNPYLLEGRKFDLRIYVLVTSFQPLKVWLAREGFARVSSEQFSLERIDERRVHLTNTSIQMKATSTGGGIRKVGEEETSAPLRSLGRKMPLSWLRRYLTECHGCEIVDRLLRSIAVTKTKLLNGSTEKDQIKDDNGSTENDQIQDDNPVCEDNKQMQSANTCESQSQNDNGCVQSIEKLIQGKGRELKSSTTVDPAMNKNSNCEDILNSNTHNLSDKSKSLNSTADNQDSFNDKNDNEHIQEKTEETSNDETDEKINHKLSNSQGVPKQKIVRIGWLHKEPTARRYTKMKKPLGGVKRLKLDESRAYSAADIRQLAIEEFAIAEDDYVVQLGLFGGVVVSDFAKIIAKKFAGKTKNEPTLMNNSFGCDDIWNYCQFLDTTPYKLNLYLLTRSKLKDNVRILYHYTRMSKYSDEIIYTECDKSQLHCYMMDQQLGEVPPIEEFEPTEHGYRISRIEKDGEVMLQEFCSELEKKDNHDAITMTRNYYLIGLDHKPDAHEIVHDLDVLQGICQGNSGLGIVISCDEKCRPVYTWYKNGVVYKSAELLCWLSDVDDCTDDHRHQRTHVWSCSVECQASGRIMKSKEVAIKSYH